MNLRLRLFVIMIGALLVVATYTFPYWLPLLQNAEEAVLFPELNEAQREAFDLLPSARQRNYLELRSADANLALRMATFALQPDIVVPEEDQAQPQREGQVALVSGEFTTITPNRSALGTATLYQLPDGSRYLWLDGFSVINGPGLRLFLSAMDLETMQELLDDDEEDNDEVKLSRDDLPLDQLRANVGNQAYDVPSEENLDLYNSVLIYSTDLDLLYSIAELEAD